MPPEPMTVPPQTKYGSRDNSEQVSSFMDPSTTEAAVPTALPTVPEVIS